MKIIKCDVPSDYRLIVSSDWHVGANNCHLTAIKSLIRDVKNSDDTFLALNGDLMESIDVSDKRFSVLQADLGLLTVDSQIDFLTDLLRPIKSKILAIGMGNHEQKHSNQTNATLRICDALGIPYGTVTFMLEMHISGKLAHRHLLTHGSGGLPKGAKDPIQRKANQGAWIKLKLGAMGYSNCITASFGHTHHLQMVSPTIEDEVHLTVKQGRIKQHRRIMHRQDVDYIPPEARWYANTGSFVRLYSDPDSNHISYGEMRMYAPPRLGYIEYTSLDGQIVSGREVVV